MDFFFFENFGRHFLKLKSGGFFFQITPQIDGYVVKGTKF